MKKINTLIVIGYFTLILLGCSNNKNSELSKPLGQENDVNPVNEPCIYTNIIDNTYPFNKIITTDILRSNSNLGSITVSYTENTHDATITDSIFTYYVDGDKFTFLSNISNSFILSADIRTDGVKILIQQLAIGYDVGAIHPDIKSGINCGQIRISDSESESYFDIYQVNGKITRITYSPYFD